MSKQHDRTVTFEPMFLFNLPLQEPPLLQGLGQHFWFSPSLVPMQTETLKQYFFSQT